MFEGTGVYFWLLFLVFLIIYITCKVALGFLFKKMHEKAWRAYIPFYGKFILINLLGMNKKIFYMTLIPIVNLYYYNIIIKELLKAFALNSNESIWFLVFPMYKFPEMAFKNPKFRLNEYELTEGFLETQNMLFEKPEETESPVGEVNGLTLDSALGMTSSNTTDNVGPSQMPNISGPETVFTNEKLQQDEHKVTYVEAPKETVEKPKQPTMRELDKGKPQVCPKCGAKLSPSADTCFLCGTRLV